MILRDNALSVYTCRHLRGHAHASAHSSFLGLNWEFMEVIQQPWLPVTQILQNGITSTLGKQAGAFVVE